MIGDYFLVLLFSIAEIPAPYAVLPLLQTYIYLFVQSLQVRRQLFPQWGWLRRTRNIERLLTLRHVGVQKLWLNSLTLPLVLLFGSVLLQEMSTRLRLIQWILAPSTSGRQAASMDEGVGRPSDYTCHSWTFWSVVLELFHIMFISDVLCYFVRLRVIFYLGRILSQCNQNSTICFK